MIFLGLARKTVIETFFQELMIKTGSKEEEISLPLPMDHVFYKFNTTERRTLYDYAVDVSPMLYLKS